MGRLVRASAVAAGLLGSAGVLAVVDSPKPSRHVVIADGHPLTIWAKEPKRLRAAILLLHGRRWSSRPNFDLQVRGERRSLMDAVVASGYAAFALDARGYGDTPRAATGWLDPDRAAADAAIALDWVARRSMALGITSRPALFGYSRGAAVALLCAQRHADKLGALLLLGFPVDLDKGFPQAVDPQFPPRTANTAADAASDFITPSAISKAAIDAYISAAVASDPVEVDWRRMELFNSLDPALVKVPTLILQGSADPGATSDKQAKLFSRLGCADRTWAVIPGSDHAAHVEDSQERLVQAVVSFLERPRRTWSGDCSETH